VFYYDIFTNRPINDMTGGKDKVTAKLLMKAESCFI
jgi:hypothetical protein